MSEKILLSDFMSLIKRGVIYVLSQYKLIVKVTLVTTCIGLAVGFLQKPKYKAVATFILEEKSSGKSGLGALASQIGFDLSGMTGGGSGLFDGDNILDIMQSRLIVEKVLLTKIDSTSNALTLADLYINVNHINKKWSSNPVLANFSFAKSVQNENEQVLRDSIMHNLFESIVKNNLNVTRQNKKGSIITIQVISKDQQFSKIFTERLLKATSNLYVEIKTGNINQNIERLQLKADSLQAKLYNKSYQAASLLNANTGIKSYVVPEEMSQRDKNVMYTLYGEVVKNLEGLKLSLINQTPIIQVLDAPKYPLIDQAYPLWMFVLGGILAGVVISSAFLLFLYTENIK